MEEGELCQGKEEAGIPTFLDHGPVQFGDGSLRARVERVEEAVLEEHVARRPARVACSDGAPGEIVLDILGINPDRIYRTRASRQDQTQGTEQDWATAVAQVPSRARAPRVAPTSPVIGKGPTRASA